jgi:hypothetical protein
VNTPSAEDQIAFLRHLQRILDEGSFVATYKYALIHAIADLCVTSGDDSGGVLTLATRSIAERFVEMYWRQTVPFPAGEFTELLKQNTGRQAAIVQRIGEIRTSYGGSLLRLKRRTRDWEELVSAVDRTVRVMPLWRLQTVGQEQVDFLYENAGRGGEITLKPGVAYCFRTFYQMITDIVRGAWVEFIHRYNGRLLGNATDLHAFLFGTDRAALARYRPILDEVQEGLCLYCGRRVREDQSVDQSVDHFIPWRRYPTDLAHNFVLAHGRCNGSKGDRLAAETHIEQWRNRNESRARLLVERFDDAGLMHDLGASVRVARWAYGQVEESGGQVWVEGNLLQPLGEEWRTLLAG